MQISLKERASHILVFKMVPFIREVAAMLGKMQIPLRERAGDKIENEMVVTG